MKKKSKSAALTLEQKKGKPTKEQRLETAKVQVMCAVVAKTVFDPNANANHACVEVALSWQTVGYLLHTI